MTRGKISKTRKPKKGKASSKIAFPYRIGALILFIAIAIGSFVPFSSTEELHETIPYRTTYQKSGDLELGQTKVNTEGRRGDKISTYETKRSLFDMLIGKEPIRQIVSTTIIKEATGKTVSEGTKR